MPTAPANGITLAWDDFGRRGDPPVLLVMGLGTQMIAWDEEFCGMLAARGRHVIRFDNRDVGASTKLTDRGVPDILAVMRAAFMGGPVDVPYRLPDMAADAFGLLDALDLAAAHVVGASMGGMIAQTMAIERPARVRTLTSIMSTTGHPGLPAARPEAMAVLLSPAPTDRTSSIERAVCVYRTIGSPGFPFDEAMIRERAALAFERGFEPTGTVRQLAAVMASGSRRDALAAVRCPTLVIHGTADPLIPVEGGHATAAAIPGAELLLIEGMGHDLPRPLWLRLVDAIAGVTARG